MAILHRQLQVSWSPMTSAFMRGMFKWSILIGATGLWGGCWQPPVLADAPPTGCPSRPAIARFRQHRVQPNETLAQIAQRYGLLSVTLMGLNPAVRSGQVVPGQTLAIPPFNGILVAVPAGQTLQSVAQIYRIRPDVLFEVNGCQRSPQMVFVPGVNWSPVAGTSGSGVMPLPAQPIDRIPSDLQQDRYPLPQTAELKRPYGWQPTATADALTFSSGVDLTAAIGTPVYAVADGTVAFAGLQPPWGAMVVINHAQGRQTRYGYLGTMKARVGQAVRRGQAIGTVGGKASALRFELRIRSPLGWVAQDPQPYLQAIAKTSASKPN
ncbi:MAG: M23 family metallopeptidase [Thermosynechococcaceae cyanobacterium]